MRRFNRNEIEALLPRVFPHGWVRNSVSFEKVGYAVYEKHSTLRVLFDAAVEDDGLRWLHISVSRRNGHMPDWFVLREVKDVFAGADALALQIVPPREEHFSLDVTRVDVAHLWVCLDRRPVPDFLKTRGGVL